MECFIGIYQNLLEIILSRYILFSESLWLVSCNLFPVKQKFRDILQSIKKLFKYLTIRCSVSLSFLENCMLRICNFLLPYTNLTHSHVNTCFNYQVTIFGSYIYLVNNLPLFFLFEEERLRLCLLVISMNWSVPFIIPQSPLIILELSQV